ncbi:MAG: DUF1566 domain-containing protein [Sphaerochaetaceae bacterium]|nr:DUF1566 domain-containing protein [Sphaerochaetaceae bacterium]
MKKTTLFLFVLLLVCASLFAVTYSEGKTLDVYPDTVLSGNEFAVHFDPNEKSATVSPYGSAKTLMVMGDKTGSAELTIGTGGSVDYSSAVKMFESNTELYMILSVDKVVVAKATFSSIVGSDFTARLGKVGSAQYVVGAAGPAGGIIFYDKGEYSDGWRYLEAAPADLKVVAGTPSIDKSDPWYDFGDDEVVFGYYRKISDGKNLFVNGTGTYNEKNCTGTAIGTGRKNTELLVKAMGNSAYSNYIGPDKTASYAAKLCSDFVYNGFDDWFLPSEDELYLMYVNLHKAGLGDFNYDGSYWSSSESDNNVEYAWKQYFWNGNWNTLRREDSLRVRAIRAF